MCAQAVGMYAYQQCISMLAWQHARLAHTLVPSCGTTSGHNDTGHVGTRTGCLGKGDHAVARMSIASVARSCETREPNMRMD